MKRHEVSVEDSVQFARIETAHGPAVWDEVLEGRREAVGNPNWKPNFIEGMGLQSRLRKILGERFQTGVRG
jgi:hypothetical protein